MAKDLRFDGRVVIVTGAGGGLGRSHALLFGGRGAKVVVNDLGGSAHGEGKSSSAADKVVAEIKAAGGEAVANYDSVENGEAIVKTALDAFGRVDVLVNNAGILRDVSFAKMTDAEWDLVYRVHVRGAYACTHAVWNHMRDAGYGRIVMTTSAAGIYGNFGQANYAMAKLGLVGLSNTLALEGKKKNVLVNAIAPIAASRLTETVMPKEMLDALKPEYVSPLVAWLCHEECEETGGLFEVGGGFMGKLRWQRTEGQSFKLGRDVTPERVRDAWSTIVDFGNVTYPADITASMGPVIANSQKKSLGGNDFIDLDEALGYEFPAVENGYDERDVALYALAVGAAKDPLDQGELRYVYELSGDGFAPLPTFAVIPPLSAIMDLAKAGTTAPGIHYGFDRVLHGEQYTEVLAPLPNHAKLKHKIRIKDIFDKGKNALVVSEIKSFDEAGNLLIVNQITQFVRGAGGFGGDRGPNADVNVPPERAPDAVVTEKIAENQALLYRLTGDWNPLHADPTFAKNFGFDRPILHGLCTFGYVGRHAIKAFCGGDPRYFKSIKVRFAESVFPGETLKTEMWKEPGGRIVLRCSVVERGKVVLSNAAIELYAEIPKLAQKPAAGAAQAAASAEPSSGDVFLAIKDYVEKNPDLGKAGMVFGFKLSNPESAWTIDLKSSPPKVVPGAPAQAECVLNLADADFLLMTQGKADPQKLFLGGKLKVDGNVMAANKLSFLQKIDPAAAKDAIAKAKAAPAAAPAPKAAAAPSAPIAPTVFDALGKRLAKDASVAKKVGAVLQFDVTGPDSAWIVDLASGKGSVASGKAGSPATTITISDADLGELAAGRATPKDLFQRGRMQVAGDVAKAHDLGFLNAKD